MSFPQAKNRIVGIHQLRKALRAGTVCAVYLADDADPALTGPIAQQCAEENIPVMRVKTMRQLGRECSISVGAACAADLR